MQSVDWQSSLNMSRPYNGLEVQATPIYSIAATIIDYTLIQKGGKTLQDFTLSQITNETAIFIDTQLDYSTLKGDIKFPLLQSALDFASLFLNLSYGLPSPSNKNVQGCILQIPLIS